MSFPTCARLKSQLIRLRSKPSGGTLATVLSILDVYSLKELRAAFTPYALSPIPGPKTVDPTTWVTKLFGARTVPDLGILTTSLAGSSDAQIVQRSWGLLGYGPKFRFAPYMKARNYLTAVLAHFALATGTLFLVIPLFRKIAKKYVYQPGDGPTKEQTKNDRFEYRGIGTPDVSMASPPRAYCRLQFEGSLYACKYSCLH